MPKYNIRNIIVAFTVLLSVFQSLAQVEICGVVKPHTRERCGFCQCDYLSCQFSQTNHFIGFYWWEWKVQHHGKQRLRQSVTESIKYWDYTATIKIANRSGTFDIIVDNKAVELKEVVVKSKKIYSQGDTINYNVASFLSQNDQALADVLKRCPYYCGRVGSGVLSR